MMGKNEGKAKERGCELERGKIEGKRHRNRGKRSFMHAGTAPKRKINLLSTNRERTSRDLPAASGELIHRRGEIPGKWKRALE